VKLTGPPNFELSAKEELLPSPAIMDLERSSWNCHERRILDLYYGRVSIYT